MSSQFFVLYKAWLSFNSSIKIFGACNQRETIERRLIWATPGQRGFPPPNADGSRVVPGAGREPRRTYNTNGPASSQAIPGPTYPQPPQHPGSSQYPTSQAVSASQTARVNPLATEQQRKQQAALLAQQDALRKAAELRSMLNTLEKVDDESRRTSLLDTLCSTEDVLKLPVHPSPPGLTSGELTVNLLRHQVLQYMIFFLYHFWWALHRAKPCSGVLIVNTPNYQRRSRINQSSSGNIRKPGTRWGIT